MRAKAWTGWRPTHMVASKITGKTLGLIGFGRIARAVGARAHHGFGMKILFIVPYPPPKEAAEAVKAQPCASVEEVLEQVRFRLAPLSRWKETRHLLSPSA